MKHIESELDWANRSEELVRLWALNDVKNYECILRLGSECLGWGASDWRKWAKKYLYIGDDINWEEVRGNFIRSVVLVCKDECGAWNE